MSARRVNRLLAGVALVLGLLAPFARNPLERASPRSAAETAQALDPTGQGRVSAETVARWLMERKPGLRIYDLRRESYSELFNLPQSERADADTLSSLPFGPDRTVVVYGENDATAIRAWHGLERRGIKAYYMMDGMGEWTRDILNPTIPPDAGPDARAAFERLAEVARYFGGLPRIAAPDSSDTARLLESTVRRGCAF